MKRIAFGSFLEEDENIIKVFHRPFFFLLIKLLLWGPLLSGILFLCWFFLPWDRSIHIYYFCIFLAGIFSLKIFVTIFFWYINAILMTNESILYVDWPKLFEKRSTRIDYANLDEITTEKVGINAFLLNYGNIYFKKLGGDNLATHTIARPTRTARIIEKYRESHVDRKNFNQESSLKKLLASMAKNHLENQGYTSENKASEQVKKTPPTHIQKKQTKPKKETQNFTMDDIEIEKVLDNQGGIDLKL